MMLKFADDNTKESVVDGAQGLLSEIKGGGKLTLVSQDCWRPSRTRGTHHITQVCPLVQEISVNIDAIRFAEILGYQGPNGWQILLFERMFVLEVS